MDVIPDRNLLFPCLWCSYIPFWKSFGVFISIITFVCWISVLSLPVLESTIDEVGRSRQVGQPCDSRSEATAKLHQCPICAYSTFRKDSMIRHIRTHTGEKPYSCVHCSYSAKTKDKLIQHVRIHTGEKPYLCPYCPCRFSSKTYLTTHVRVHTGEKPYACSLCPYRSAQRSTLVTHFKRHNRV